MSQSPVLHFPATNASQSAYHTLRWPLVIDGLTGIVPLMSPCPPAAFEKNAPMGRFLLRVALLTRLRRLKRLLAIISSEIFLCWTRCISGDRYFTISPRVRWRTNPTIQSPTRDLSIMPVKDSHRSSVSLYRSSTCL